MIIFLGLKSALSEINIASGNKYYPKVFLLHCYHYGQFLEYRTLYIAQLPLAHRT